MTIDPYILTFSALTVIATIWMGFWSARKSKTTSDFFVAGRSVSVGWNASAISGEYLSAASFMGVAGMVMSSGYDALWYPVCYACGYLFLLLFIAGPLRRFGAYTIPDFAEGRFDSPVFRKIAVVFVLFIGFFYTMPQMKGAGTTLAYIFPGLPYQAGVVLVGAVITLNVALGGMKGITLVQAFQYWAKMFAISVPIFVLMAVYGHYGKQVGVNGDQALITSEIAGKLRAEAKPVELPKDFPGTLANAYGTRNPENYRFRLLIKAFPSLDKIGFPYATNTSITLNEYSDFGNCEVLCYGNLPKVLTNWTISKIEWLPRRKQLKQVEDLLAANGISLVRVGKEHMVAVATPQLNQLLDQANQSSDSIRKLLPSKAPRDETWLNPFGPLTTKAAKNAAAAIARQSSRAGADFILVASPDVATRTRSASLKSGVTNIASPLPANTLMHIDKALARITESFGVDSFRTADVPTSISGAASANALAYESGLAFVKQTLAGNGVALLQRGNSVYAVPAGRADFYKTRLEEAQGPMPLRANLSPEQRMTVNLDSPPVAQVLAIYSDLTGRQLLPSTNSVAERVDDLLAGALSKWRLVPRPPTPDSGVRVHGDGAFTAAEVKTAIEAHLRTNGLGLVPVGEKGFRVEGAPGILPGSGQAQGGDYGVSSTEIRQDAGGTFAADVQKAWLDKHEKPLALLYTYSLIIAIVCGTAGLPHILVRFYTNPDGTAAKKTTMWVMILIGVFYLFPPIFGVMGRNLLPSLYAGAGAKGTDKVVLELPRILNEGKSTNSQFPIPNSQSSSSPTGPALGIENLESRNAPLKKRGIPWGSILSGITCAGAFAAFMSTFSGLLVSMTGALAHDIYGRILRPKATPEQRLRMFKISAVIIGAIAILLGSFVEPLQINFMVGQAFAIAAASYFPLLFMSVWWRGMTMKGAAAGMLAGGICALAAVTITNFSDLKWIDLSDFWATNPLLRILCEQPAIWTVPLAIALMVLVSKFTAREIPSDSRMKMLVLHAPEQLGLKQEYIQEHQPH